MGSASHWLRRTASLDSCLVMVVVMVVVVLSRRNQSSIVPFASGMGLGNGHMSMLCGCRFVTEAGCARLMHEGEYGS
ncbi:hypothetical protein LX36DRAFT_663890 [Colletotrichum falcatum]|nr:hypothetical protein LX36DRAFT_663890 [Colletotrichum falcatum]